MQLTTLTRNSLPPNVGPTGECASGISPAGDERAGKPARLTGRVMRPSCEAVMGSSTKAPNVQAGTVLMGVKMKSCFSRTRK